MSENTFTIKHDGDTWRILGTGLMRDGKIMYRLNGAWMPYSEYLHKGYFEVKTGEKDGKSYSLCYFTPKGEVWITEKWNKRNAVAKA